MENHNIDNFEEFEDSTRKNKSIEENQEKNIFDNDNFKQEYYEIENHLKIILNRNLEKQFKQIYDKLKEKEKSYFELINLTSLNWVFNINTVYSNRGDLSSSSLQKFFHMIFKDFDENTRIQEISLESQFKNTEIFESKSDIQNHSIIEGNQNLDPKSEYLKFKNSFVELFNSTYIMTLSGDNLILENFNFNEQISKFEFKNGFLNIFLKGRAKELVESLKKKNEKKTKWSRHEEQGYMVNIYKFCLYLLIISLILYSYLNS